VVHIKLSLLFNTCLKHSPTIAAIETTGIQAMLDIKKITTLSDLSKLKSAYFADSTAPLDGMWHFGFV